MDPLTQMAFGAARKLARDSRANADALDYANSEIEAANADIRKANQIIADLRKRVADLQLGDAPFQRTVWLPCEDLAEEGPPAPVVRRGQQPAKILALTGKFFVNIHGCRLGDWKSPSRHPGLRRQIPTPDQ